MRVLLVHVDGKMPNLALMKLAGFHIDRGDHVELLREGGFWTEIPDRVYFSCIFPQNAYRARQVATWFTSSEIQFGGPGFEKPSELPYEVEHHKPWYPLYPFCDFDMGFTSRGCPKKCPFCYVPMLEGKFREHADIEEFHDPRHKKIVLLDNNFLYSSRWEETLDFINSRKMKVSFNQGLDFRFLTHEKAVVLTKTMLYPWSFKQPSVCFAWDLMEEEPYVKRGIQLLKDAGMGISKVQVYILVGFNTTHDQDLYRVKEIINEGLDPFVMVYNNRKDDPWIKKLQRWANRHLYSVCDFKDYDASIKYENN